MSNLYFHYPFCKQACHYCNFHFSTNQKQVDQMWHSMQRELEIRFDEVKVPLQSIYFGGGSPSLLPPDKIASLLDQVKSNHSIHDSLEITMEVNPDDVTREYLKEIKQAGVNRLSLGIQSFQEKDLQLMNRAHTVDHALNALEWVSDIFLNFSIDLIYGMPGSTLKEWEENLNKALEFNPPHISTYALTVEEKTALYHQVEKGEVLLVDEDEVKAQYDLMRNRLEELNFINYEFSNFGKEGFFSVNNQNYWNGRPYIGIGPSAHSYDGVSIRSWNVSNNHKYISSIDKGELDREEEFLSKKDQYNEYIMTGLRKIEGLSLEYIELTYGKMYAAYFEAQVSRHLKERNLFWDGDFLKITPKAKFLTDGLAADLFKI
ncbi:radical SAM family heme chaperone HemW [Flavobacteriaceae bacterium]|nr:radical SAM family heme chaperone HemW [Flavobacteriaceae bacterium]MDB2340539.1 radical SAM family heme chaperone HemW [Flavobacteriaceae bacterium]MDC1056191.1 radical SAM family heme chaperone HemW [Flavobacteriaceae bacterium]